MSIKSPGCKGSWETTYPNLVNADLPPYSKYSNIRPMTYKTTSKYNSKSILWEVFKLKKVHCIISWGKGDAVYRVRG